MPREPKPPLDASARTETTAAQGETAAQALERARGHARRAVGEALAAARALLDAAAIGWSGRPSDAHSALRSIAEVLDAQSARFAEGEGGVPVAMMNAVLEALDQEIARWERQASKDSEARAVLRTFLGLREILWEFGLRRDAPGEEEASPPRPRRKTTRKPRAKPGSGPRRPGRVQRVDVQS